MEDIIRKTKNKIKKLAKEFDLTYNPKIFTVLIISKKDFVKLIYLLGCPAEPYILFGKTINERIKNYIKFISSREFSKQIKEPSGSVVEKKFCQETMKKIKDNKLKKEFKEIIDKLKLNNSIQTTVITKPANKREKNLVSIIIFHEWIHVILTYNNIFFQRIKSNYWNFDEGLTEYLQLFLKKRDKDFEKEIKDRIEKRRLKGKLDNYIEQIFEKLLFWNKILRNKKSPKDRYKSILNILKEMKTI